MAQVQFWEKPGCGGNAKQKAWLLAAGHKLEVHDLLSWPWTAASLLVFLETLSVSDWFNRAAPAVKAGEVVPETLDRYSAIALLLAQPLLIRRPLLQVGDQRRVGFDPAAIDAWIGLSPNDAARPAAQAEGCAAAPSARPCPPVVILTS